jgi:DNA-binding CsgD family transcriptional regulator
MGSFSRSPTRVLCGRKAAAQALMYADPNKFKQLETLAVSAVVLDRKGNIVGVNDVWKSFGKRNGLRVPNFGIGLNYLAYCGQEQQAAPNLARDLRDLMAGRRDMVTTIYPCHSPTKRRWFFLIAFALSREATSSVTILHANLTKLMPLPDVFVSSADELGSRHPFNRIAGTVEASVSKSLSKQLAVMTKGISVAKADAASTHETLVARLTKRQLEILHLLGEGKSNAEIAAAVFRSPHTIKLHVSAILKQLNVRSRTQAALIASNLPRRTQNGKR